MIEATPPAFLTLGTVQLGMPYGLGLAAQQGGLDEASVVAILDRAASLGIRHLDTARSYGESERRIGAWLQQRRQSASVVTKLGKLGGIADADVAMQIRRDIDASRDALGLRRLSGVLTHSPLDICRPVVADSLRQLCDAGVIDHFGASIYSDAEAQAALAIEGLSLLQVPASVFNQTFLKRPDLLAARRRGVDIRARSIYVQGLLLMAPEALPRHLHSVAPLLTALRNLAEAADCSLSALVLAPVMADPAIASVIVGCDSVEQVEAAALAIRSAVPAETISAACRLCAGLPETIYDPRKWNK